MRTETEMLSLIYSVAKKDEEIRAVYLTGSRTEKGALVDKYSDFDVVYIVRDIRSMIQDKQWLSCFGEPLLIQTPSDWFDCPYDYSGNDDYVFLMQFTDGNRIDLTLVDQSRIYGRLAKVETRRVVLNKDGISGLTDIDDVYDGNPNPSEKEFTDCWNEFWWLCINIGKGINRKEYFYVKYLMERLQMDMLLKMLGWKSRIEKELKVSYGKYNRYLSKYLNNEEMLAITRLSPNVDWDDIKTKQMDMCHYFYTIAQDTALNLGFIYPATQADNVMEYFNKIQTPVR